MKILVPTDFSTIAYKAYDLALKLAGLTEGSVVLFHCMDYPEDWKSMRDRDIELFDKATAEEQKAIRNFEKMQLKANPYDIDVSYFIKSFKFFKQLKAVIAAENIDLVVMGSHGLSGASEWYIGSNAQKVVRALHAPVLVIKDTADIMDFTQVLFATDLKSEDKNALRQFLAFLKPFKPEKIHILAINTMGYFNQPTLIMKELLKEFKELVEDIPCETHFYKDITVRRGIQQFSKEYGISLIGISNHERHPIKRIFQGSNVEMLINHSYIPVLAIDY